MTSVRPNAREIERLALLRALEILDTPPEEEFDRYTRVLSSSLSVPIAVVSLIDRDRQWFKSSVGLGICEIPRDMAFCVHAAQGTEVLVVNDTLEDERFRNNPLVTGPPGIRFYAGHPILSAEGLPLGTLCALDIQPRQLSEEQLRVLVDLSQMLRREFLQREAALLGTRHVERLTEVAAEATDRARSIFRYSALGIAIVAPDGTWLEVNPAVCRIVGYTEEEMLRLTFQDITHADDLVADLGLVEQLLAGAIEQFSLEKRYIRKDGSVVWVRLTVALCRDADGTPDYFISLIEDIQQRKAAEDALQAMQSTLEQRIEQRTRDLRQINEQLTRAIGRQARTERQLKASEAMVRAVIEHAYDAYVSVDINGVINGWNQRATSLFGWSREEVIGRTLNEAFIVPGAHKQDMRSIRRLAQRNATLNREKPIEIPGTRRDGSIFPMEVRMWPVGQGEEQSINAFLHDISERKAAETALRRSHEQLRAVADHLPIVLSFVDENFTIQYANLQHSTMLGLSPGAVVGKRVDEVLPRDAIPPVMQAIARALAGETTMIDFPYTDPSATVRHLHGTYVPHDSGPRVRGVYAMVQDVTERRTEELERAREARQDALTGLPNRRALFELLPEAMLRGRASQRNMAVLFMDLNGFKAVNDRLGHEAGDALLREVARRLLGLISSGDTAARLAGDEFVMVLENMHDALEAQDMVQRVAETIAQPIDLGGTQARVTASVGMVLCTPDSRHTADSLLREADTAMYAAKRARRGNPPASAPA